MRLLILSCFAFLCSIISWAQKTIVVSNPTSAQRSELIAIPAEQLGVKPRAKLIVRDVFDIEQPTQWTYDGRLLMSVYVKPNGKATFTVQEGMPAAFERSWVSGRMYPERLEDIPRAYQSAKESLEYGAFLKNSGVIWYDGLPEATLPVHAYDRIDMEKLKGFIRRGDPKGLKDYLDHELTAMTAEAAPSVNQVCNLLMHIAVRTTDCFREIYGGMNAFREPRDFDYAQLFTLRRFSDMRAWLFRLCDELFSRNESVLGRSASVVGFAIAYINQHYREGVTLKQVAAECHINTSYLGQVFHKETGSAFTDYVNALRIAEARRLLNNPTLKVYEVAEQVGFTDYHYFLKIFKKVTGITPSDLRS